MVLRARRPAQIQVEVAWPAFDRRQDQQERHRLETRFSNRRVDETHDDGVRRVLGRVAHAGACRSPGSRRASQGEVLPSSLVPRLGAQQALVRAVDSEGSSTSTRRPSAMRRLIRARSRSPSPTGTAAKSRKSIFRPDSRRINAKYGVCRECRTGLVVRQTPTTTTQAAP